MPTMKRLIIIALFFAFSVVSAQVSVPILDRKVSIKAVNQTISKVLDIIAETADFNFSYSPGVIKVNKIITVQADSRTVKEVLDQIFNGEVSYQQIGNHLVLQKVYKPKAVSPSSTKYNFIITGYLRDGYTGDGLKNVSVYERNSLVSCLSGDFGYYQLSLVSKVAELEIRYSHQDYPDTVVKINYGSNGVHTIHLSFYGPIPKEVVNDIDSIASSEIDTTVNQSADTTPVSKTVWVVDFLNSLQEIKLEDTKLAKWVVSNKQRVLEKNIRDSFYRNWQLTFFPPVGTNGRLSGLVTNNFSINLLGGYNGGVSGLELGGLLNILKGNMNGAQFAGFGNIIGGNTKGAQLAGFMNHNMGKMHGFQAAGFYNFNRLSASGAQFAGFANVNFSKSDALQAAGFTNVNYDKQRGTQLAGFGNYNFKGSKGTQIAGFMNLSLKRTKGFQLSGFMNVAEEIKGGQISGFLNIAKRVKGVQIGVINIADTASGFCFGILNFIRNGIHQVEISSNETGMFGLYYRSGVKSLYSIAGITTAAYSNFRQELMGYGYGVGTGFKLAKPVKITAEFIANQMGTGLNTRYVRIWSRAQLNLELVPVKGLSIFGGVAINGFVADATDPGYDGFYSTFGGTDVLEENSGRYPYKMWTGYQFGIRLF